MSSLTVRYQDGVAQVRFNRPDVLNALDIEQAQSLLHCCRELAADANLRVLVLRGEGRAFMAGGDLQQLRAAPQANAALIIEPMHQAISLLAHLPVPVIACVHGAVAGAGLSLMLAADLVLAAEGTRFNFAYTDIGTCCDGGASWSLPHLLGLRKALQIALLNQPFATEQALQWGLVTQVVAAEAMDETLEQMVIGLKSREAPALAHLKRLLRSAHSRSLDEQLAEEQAAFLDCVKRPEFVAAVDAFYAKRKPVSA